MVLILLYFLLVGDISVFSDNMPTSPLYVVELGGSRTDRFLLRQPD